MTIEPNELHAIKASVAAFLTAQPLDEAVDLHVALLDAIDRGAADAAARRVIMFDADTGEELMPSEAATGDVRAIMAASLMPGWTAAEIDRAYGEWLSDDADPRPFAVGSRVKSRELPPLLGRVVRRVEEAGELHTVAVVWDTQPGEYLYSPRELGEVRA